MPLFTRKCAHCGHKEDHLERYKDDIVRKCPTCGKEPYGRIMAPTAANFKTLEDQCRGE